MNTLLIIISIIASISVATHIVVSKVKYNIEKVSALVVNYSIVNSTDFIQNFSPDIINVYTDIIKNPEGWILTDHTLYKQDGSISIWAANNIDSRGFYNGNNRLGDPRNAKLKYCDKVLLDKIIIAYKEKQSKIVAKFFI